MAVKMKSHDKEIKAELEAKRRMALEMIGQKAETIWKMLITAGEIVDTGNFRNSVSFEVKTDEVELRNTAEYAVYIELGTSKMPARPTLKPAILDYKEDYKNIVEAVMKS